MKIKTKCFVIDFYELELWYLTELRNPVLEFHTLAGYGTQCTRPAQEHKGNLKFPRPLSVLGYRGSYLTVFSMYE